MCITSLLDELAGQNQEGEPFKRLYRVGDILGKGGFGTVYAGVRVRDGKQVAIKHIDRNKVSDWDLVSFVKLSAAFVCCYIKSYNNILVEILALTHHPIHTYSLQLNGRRVPLELKLLVQVQIVPGVIRLIDCYERHDFLFT